MARFDGSAAPVTGGSPGIHEAIADADVAAGATVVLDGVKHGTQTALPHRREIHGRGIDIGSKSGRIGGRGAAASAAGVAW